jgi:hypothetical protein
MTDPLATLADFADDHRAVRALLSQYTRTRVDAIIAAGNGDTGAFTAAARAFLDVQGHVTAWVEAMAVRENTSSPYKKHCAAALGEVGATRSRLMTDLCALGTADYKDRLVMVEACAPLLPLTDALTAAARAGDVAAFRGHAAQFAREARRCVRPPCGAVAAFVGEVLADLRRVEGGPWANDLADCVQISALTQMSVLAQRGHTGESSQDLFHAAQSLFTMARAQHALPLPEDASRFSPAARAIMERVQSAERLELAPLCATFAHRAAPVSAPAACGTGLLAGLWARIAGAVQAFIPMEHNPYPARA